MASDKIPTRERRPSVGAPIVDIQGSVGPAGISRPKHKRTLTGFGASEIKNVEGMCFVCFCYSAIPIPLLLAPFCFLLAQLRGGWSWAKLPSLPRAPPTAPHHQCGVWFRQGCPPVCLLHHPRQTVRQEKKQGGEHNQKPTTKKTHNNMTLTKPPTCSQPPSPNPNARPG